MKYLSLVNWGTWKLPYMGVSYNANQYDCEGKIAVTITFDSPVEILEGEWCDKVQYGAPVGHLTKYRRIR